MVCRRYPDKLFLFRRSLNCSTAVGLILGAVIGDANILGTSEKLPILFSAPAVFSVLFFLTLPWVPQSPSWIIIKKELPLGDAIEYDKDDIEEVGLIHPILQN